MAEGAWLYMRAGALVGCRPTPLSQNASRVMADAGCKRFSNPFERSSWGSPRARCLPASHVPPSPLTQRPHIFPTHTRASACTGNCMCLQMHAHGRTHTACTHTYAHTMHARIRSATHTRTQCMLARIMYVHEDGTHAHRHVPLLPVHACTRFQPQAACKDAWCARMRRYACTCLHTT